MVLYIMHCLSFFLFYP
uniref:Uncharacterized protein n=1 Tax=Rhizophora mucronata TaxID=61149 RepID=A0A2P2IHV0_RHIMU